MIRRRGGLLRMAVVVSLLAGCSTTPSTGQHVGRRIAASASQSPTAGACRWLPIPPGNEGAPKLRVVLQRVTVVYG